MRLIPNPSYIAKNQTASSAPVEVFIQPLSAHSSVSEDKVWCPVRALKYYWHRTQAKRSGDQLFIITKEPFSPASRDTISKWVVAAIQAAGPAALTPGVSPRAHDTRSVSTSWALFSGVFSGRNTQSGLLAFAQFVYFLLFTGHSCRGALLFQGGSCCRGSVPLVRCCLGCASVMPPLLVCVGLAYFEQIGGRMY